GLDTRLEGPVQLELETKRVAELGESTEVFLELRCLARLLSEHDLVVDQIEEALLIVRQGRLPLQVRFHTEPLAPSPAITLIDPQDRHQVVLSHPRRHPYPGPARGPRDRRRGSAACGGPPGCRPIRPQSGPSPAPRHADWPTAVRPRTIACGTPST